MFLRAAKTDAEEAGIETEGMAQSVAKLRDDILKIAKVDIMIDDNNFKSTYQILDEISQKWEELADVDRANLLNLMGGKRNANVLSSIIENFDEARSAMEASANAEGSALAENEKFLDSIAGHINKLTVAYEDLSQTVLSSDMIKYGVDFLTEVVKGLTNIVGFLDQIGGILPAITTVIGSSILNTHQLGFGTQLRDGKTQFTLLGKTITGVDSDWKKLQGDMTDKSFWQRLKTNVGIFTSTLNSKLRKDMGLIAVEDIEKTKQAINDFDLELYNVDASTPEGLKKMDEIFTSWTTNGGRLENVDIQTQECVNSIMRLRKASKDTSPVIMRYSKSLDEAGKSARLSATLGNIFKNIVANIGSMLLSAGISMAISLIIQGLTNLVQAYNNSIQAIEDANDAIKTAESNFAQCNEEIKITQQRIRELSQIEKPTLLEKEELERLREYNQELEQRKKLEDYNSKKALSDQNKASQDAWRVLMPALDRPYIDQFFTSVITGNNIWSQRNTVNGFEAVVNGYRQLLDDFAQGLYEGNEEAFKRLEDDYQKQVNEMIGSIYDMRQTYALILSGLDENDPNNTQSISYLSSEIERIDNILAKYEGKSPQTLTALLDSSDYDDVVSKLKELAKQNQLTEETFNKVEGIEKFKEALVENNFNDISEVIRAIVNEVAQSGDEAEKAAPKISIYAEQLAKIKDSVDNATTMRANLQSAFDTISDGGFLSDDDIKKFRDYPEIFGQFVKTTDGWTISVNALKEAYSNLGKEARDAIQQARDNTVDEIQAKRREYSSRKSYSVTNVNSYYEARLAYDKNKDKLEDLSDEIKVGEESLKAYDTLLQMFVGDLTKTAEEIEDCSKAVSRWTSIINVGVKAQQEMQEQGHLSASTYLELIETADDYYKYIQIENGAIKFNYELFKEQAKAKLADEIATLELARAEALYNRNVDAMYGGRNHERLQAILTETELKLKVAKAFYEDFDPTWEDTLGDKPTDTTDSDYQRRLNKLKDANDNTIESERQFIKDWTALNEEIYKATDPEKYEDNLREIREYIKGLNGLLDTYLEKWGKVNSYDENSIASRTIRLAEARRVNYSTYGDPNSLFYNLDTYEKNAADQAKYEADTLKLRFDRGLVDYQTFISGIRRIRESARDRDGNYLLDMTFVSGYEDRDKQFSEQLDMLQRFNDKSLDDEAEYVRQWKALNDEIYKGTGITKYESNLKEIANYERDLLDRRFKEGLISAEDYRAGLISLWEDNNAILGEGVLNEWLSGAVDNEKAELDRLYSEGKISAKEYFDYVEALWEENQNILGQRTQEEWLEDAWKKRAETEKTYWEQQKDLATDYYDAELKKLQDVKDEEEKISKAEELRLNLIKARKALEDAKSQRNQLVFHNGTFEYMADQEAVMSAQEEIAEALKAIKDNELEEQIKLLEEQKDEALLFYDNIIGMLDYYLNDTKQILTSDSEVIDHAEASESGQYFRRLMNGEITMDEVKEEYKKKYTKDPDTEKKAEEKRNTWSEQAKAILGMGPAALMQLNLELWDKAGFGVNVGALGSATAQDIASSAVDNVYNNSSINNDNSVKVGDIHMTIQGGTSVEMLNEFASKLGSAISTLAPRAIAAI